MKGLGYSLELIASIFILIAFAATGFQVPKADQNWRDYQEQVAAQDLSYALRDSGHLQHFIKKRELGGLRTTTQQVTDRDLKVSGSVSNLPIKETSIGFNTYTDRIHTQSLEEVSSGDRCYGGLEEIKRDSNTDTLLKTDGTGLAASNGVTLYFADTDPKSLSGDDGTLNYDSVWVDNGTKCQFSPAEGPFYLDQFFFWGDGSGHHYDLKGIDGSAKETTLYDADQVLRFRQTMNREVNGVDTYVSFDTFRYDTDSIKDYDITVFRKRDSLGWINADPSRLRQFMKEGSAMLLMNLQQSDFSGGFIPQTGLKWVDLPLNGGSTGTEGRVSFPGSGPGQEVSDYFHGQGGDNSLTGLKPDGKVSSSPDDILVSDMMAYTMDVTYDRSAWNATNMNMNSGPDVSGLPESDCGRHYFGDLHFDATGKTYDAVVSELGVCKGVYGVSIDHNPADGDLNDPEEGPFLNGEEVVVDNRTYKVKTYPAKCSPMNCVELVYSGPKQVETINYRQSFPDFNGQRLARAGYEDHYSEDDRKALASALYWLRGDSVEFSSGGDPVTSTSISGGIKEQLYMPYKVQLRWKD